MNNQADFTKGSIPGKLIGFMLPIMGALVLQAMYSAVDLMIVGRFGNEIPKFLRIGAPLALQDVLTNMTFLAICAFVNRIGLEASSGYGVSQRIVYFIMLIPSALVQSMASFVAQNVGAGNERRAFKATLCGMAIGVSIGIPVALLTFFHGDLLAEIFTRDPRVADYAFQFLRGFAPEAIVTSILFSFYGYYNGHSRSTFVMIQSMIQSLFIRLPVSYFMSIRENATLTGIGAAAPCATVIGIILCIIYYFYLKKNALLLSEESGPGNPDINL